MNDDLESAEEGLRAGNSSFHKVRRRHTLVRLQQMLMDKVVRNEGSG